MLVTSFEKQIPKNTKNREDILFEYQSYSTSPTTCGEIQSIYFINGDLFNNNHKIEV